MTAWAFRWSVAVLGCGRKGAGESSVGPLAGIARREVCYQFCELLLSYAARTLVDDVFCEPDHAVLFGDGI